jgi:hypothetical protein
MIFSSYLKTFFWCIVPAIVAGVVVAYVLSPAYSGDNGAPENFTTVPEDVEEWIAIMNEFGGERAYQLFAEKHGHKNINVTHDLAHSFGEALYKTQGIDGVTVCDSNYAFGCYHSFFGWALIENGIDIISELDEACIAVYGEKGLGCQHGIGHGVMVEVGPDELTQALEACSTLNWQGPVGGCSSGVFMEYNHSTMGTNVSRSYSPEAAHYPCTEIDARFQPACYFEQAAWWIQQPGLDFESVGTLCAEVPDDMNREMCYRGTGNVASGASGFDIEFVINACGSMATTEGINMCTEGAVWLFTGEQDVKDSWPKLCEPLDPEGKQQCLRNIDFI